MKKKLQIALLFVAGMSALTGLFVRIFNLGFPSSRVFDEAYFPEFAADFVSGKWAFDVHPPLGKLLMAIPIWIFGDHPISWRLIPLVCGILLMILIPAVWWWMRKDWIGALLLLIFISLEPILVVYSRTGLLDGILLIFIVLAFGLAYVVKKPWHFAGLAIVIGLAASVKWVGLGVLPPIMFVVWRRKLLRPFLLALPLTVLTYGLVVFGGELVGNTGDYWNKFWWWHDKALGYHLHLHATHPWSSQWWTWPLMKRPVLMFYETDSQGLIRLITALGNPLLWWSSTIATVLSGLAFIYRFIKRKNLLDWPVTPLLIGYAAFMLPWVPIHRVMFLYHYLPAYIFALFMLVYWLRRIGKTYSQLVGLFVLVIIASAIWFMPWAIGWPLTAKALSWHVWVHSWLY